MSQSIASSGAMQVGEQEGLLREMLSQIPNLKTEVKELKLSSKPQSMDVGVEEEVEGRGRGGTADLGDVTATPPGCAQGRGSGISFPPPCWTTPPLGI